MVLQIEKVISEKGKDLCDITGWPLVDLGAKSLHLRIFPFLKTDPSKHRNVNHGTAPQRLEFVCSGAQGVPSQASHPDGSTRFSYVGEGAPHF